MVPLGFPEQGKQRKERGVTDYGRDELRWRKSSHSGGGNDCVEIAAVGSAAVGNAASTVGAAVRDSKNPDGPQLRFGARGWVAFVGRARTDLTAH
jgi:hypothetical protein